MRGRGRANKHTIDSEDLRIKLISHERIWKFTEVTLKEKKKTSRRTREEKSKRVRKWMNAK